MNKKIRTAVRTVVINKSNQVLLIHATKKDYYQLPGGGVELEVEDIKTAATRETLEETGYKVELIKDLGIYEEIREEMINRSYGFLARTILQHNKALANDERDFENAWMSFEEATKIMQNSLNALTSLEYKSFFERELEFLKRTRRAL